MPESDGTIGRIGLDVVKPVESAPGVPRADAPSVVVVDRAAEAELQKPIPLTLGDYWNIGVKKLGDAAFWAVIFVRLKLWILTLPKHPMIQNIWKSFDTTMGTIGSIIVMIVAHFGLNMTPEVSGALGAICWAIVGTLAHASGINLFLIVGGSLATVIPWLVPELHIGGFAGQALTALGTLLGSLTSSSKT